MSQYEGFVYEWINKKNGKWYIGSHKGTPDDGYISSSKPLNKAISEEGIGNFYRHVFLCDNYREEEDAALKRRKAGSDPMSYNIMSFATPSGWEEVNNAGLNTNKANHKKVMHEGIEYPSQHALAKHLGVSEAFLCKRLKENDTFEFRPWGHPVEIHGVRYNTKQDAAEALGMFPSTVARRIKRKVKGYIQL